MRKTVQLKLLFIKEVMDFNVIDYLYINRVFKYVKSILTHIIGVFQK